jgi:oxygen-independent coproporphyrinogen-3 oxidase
MINEKKAILMLGAISAMNEIVIDAKKMGYYVIVTDYLENSPAKKHADETWMLSIDDVEGIVAKCRERNVDGVIALQPENITVHTLALKKGADLFEKRQNLPSQQQVAQMVEYAGQALAKAGYTPYYLYRQKYMSGSFENVGWSKPDKDCLYNIYMMEELHSILSLGGGGMSKLNLPGGKVERWANPKFPEEYIDRIEKVLSDKTALLDRMKGSD